MNLEPNTMAETPQDVVIEGAAGTVIDRPASDAPGRVDGVGDRHRADLENDVATRLDAVKQIERAGEELHRSLKREAGVRARLATVERENHLNAQFAALLNAILDSYQDHPADAPHPPEAPPMFDDARYCDLNPDVKAAVAAGHIGSGFEHFLKHGRRENRSWR